MKSTATYGLAVGCLVANFLCTPAVTLALPDTPGQRAGEISRIIPAVNIVRGQTSLEANQKSPVYWKDAVHTLPGGRARVSLDDGSVLNLGSSSNAIITKHDAGAQQTDLALGVGKMRVQAQKISQHGGKFTVHTPVGIAGVIGTDFFVDYANGVMKVIVLTGRVTVCNLKEICVEVGSGETTSVSDIPLHATPAPPNVIAEAVSDTSLETPAEQSERNFQPLGFASKASSSHIGASLGAKGSPMYAGELLSTDSGGLLTLGVGTIEIKLEGGSAAHIYRTPYGAVVDLTRGSLVYKTPSWSQSLVIVAADVRITPSSETPGSGRVSFANPCNLAVQSWRGRVYVLDGSKLHLVDSGRSSFTFAEHSVSYRQWISPDAGGYHNGHTHRACSFSSGIDSPFLPASGNPTSPGPTGVPEPATLHLIAIGILALVAFTLKKLLTRGHF